MRRPDHLLHAHAIVARFHLAGLVAAIVYQLHDRLQGQNARPRPSIVPNSYYGKRYAKVPANPFPSRHEKVESDPVALDSLLAKTSPDRGQPGRGIEKIGALGTCLLSHHRGVLGADLVQHAHFTGLRVRIFIHAHILLGHLVDVSGAALLGDLHYSAANFQVAIRIVRIDNGQRDPWFTAYILVLLPASRGVENHVLAVEVAPHRRHLRTAVGHQRGETGEGALLKQITILFWDDV